MRKDPETVNPERQPCVVSNSSMLKSPSFAHLEGFQKSRNTGAGGAQHRPSTYENGKNEPEG